ncbi:20283_t:CDS:2, partial [Entrophospora sp. SA101]
EKFSTFRNVTEEAKKKANKGEFFVNPFKRHKSTENIATDNNNSLASIEELQNEITKLKKEIEALTMYSINEMTDAVNFSSIFNDKIKRLTTVLDN